jgi:F0F1-type ATP synthase epsilon subunit
LTERQREGIAVTYGFVDVTPEKVIILAEEAYTIGEIDVGKEKEEFEKWARKLATAPNNGRNRRDHKTSREGKDTH